MTLETKTCDKCKLDLPLSSFYNRPERNGIQKFCCKECHKAAMKVYREANREKVKASQRRTVAKKREYYTAKARDGYHRRKAQGGKDWSELGVFHDDHLLVQLAADYLARFK